MGASMKEYKTCEEVLQALKNGKKRELEQCSTDIVNYERKLEYLKNKRETLFAELKAIENLEEI